MCTEELLEKQSRWANFAGGIFDGSGWRILVVLTMLSSCYGNLCQSN
jgi:hypothetical protein